MTCHNHETTHKAKMNMEKSNGSIVAVEPSWAELLGSKDWEGLLDPLDLTLRSFILRCGDFCQCTYDAFNDDDNSPYYGSSRYGKKSFFERVKFEFAAAYEVSSFLYATSTLDLFVTWDRDTNFMGYVAVSSDAVSKHLGRREIYVVWRGTETKYEWIDDTYFALVPATPLLHVSTAADAASPRVMDGWLNIYTSSNPNSEFHKLSAREQLQRKINRLRQDYKDESLSIVLIGHSLGSALAVLSAFDLVENGVRDIPVAAVVFACPRVGDAGFVERLRQYPNLKILHAKNLLDLVPHYPSELLGYRDAGVEIEVDGRISPSLKSTTNVTDWHNLQGILHVVAGWHGQEGPFEVVVKRSLALVNKSSALLKDEFKIPESWWVVENKGMVLNEKGEWVLKPPPDEDRPVPEFS